MLPTVLYRQQRKLLEPICVHEHVWSRPGTCSVLVPGAPWSVPGAPVQEARGNALNADCLGCLAVYDLSVTMSMKRSIGYRGATPQPPLPTQHCMAQSWGSSSLAFRSGTPHTHSAFLHFWSVSCSHAHRKAPPTFWPSLASAAPSGFCLLPCSVPESQGPGFDPCFL